MYKLTITSLSPLYLPTLQYIYDKYEDKINEFHYLEELSNPVFDWNSRKFKSNDSRKILCPSENIYKLNYDNEIINIHIECKKKENGDIIKIFKSNACGEQEENPLYYLHIMSDINKGILIKFVDDAKLHYKCLYHAHLSYLKKKF